MNQTGHSIRCVAAALLWLLAINFPPSALADDEDDRIVERLGREIAERFVAAYFGEHSAEHDLFIATAETGGTDHYPADGHVIRFYDDHKNVTVSTTLRRVMSIVFRRTGSHGECSPDDERALAPKPDHYLAEVQRFLDATAPEVYLTALTPQPHVSLCWGGGRSSSHTWRELPDAEGVYYGSTRVEVKFDLFTKQIHGFTVQTMNWDGTVAVDAEHCRKIVTRRYCERSGCEITRLVLARVFPLDGPAYPVWAATVEIEPVTHNSLRPGKADIDVNVHAITGEIIDDLEKYSSRDRDERQ